VDFSILEEHGHVNVYAIWDILRWARKAKRVAEAMTHKRLAAAFSSHKVPIGQKVQAAQKMQLPDVEGHAFPTLGHTSKQKKKNGK
jgi:hypothetical protein